MPDQLLQAAAIQLNSTADSARNLATAEQLVRAAVSNGASIVVLPEKWNILGTREQMLAGAEPLTGKTITWARSIAAQLKIDLIAGSILEQDGDRRHNTCVHVGPDGEIRAIYRKLHLFDVEVGGVTYRESDTETAGEEIVTSKLETGSELGLSICYDLRFCELYRALSLRGAQLFTIPSAFTLTTTRDHWGALLRARAIENQAFVIAANQIGKHEPDRHSGGRSMIVDPWGVVLAQAPDKEAYITAELDFDKQAQIRQRLARGQQFADGRPRRSRACRVSERDLGPGADGHAAARDFH